MSDSWRRTKSEQWGRQGEGIKRGDRLSLEEYSGRQPAGFVELFLGQGTIQRNALIRKRVCDLGEGIKKGGGHERSRELLAAAIRIFSRQRRKRPLMRKSFNVLKVRKSSQALRTFKPLFLGKVRKVRKVRSHI